MNILKITTIGRYTLAIFYTSSDCYQYSIVGEDGVVFEPDSIFYTSEAAEREAREAIKAVSN